jgi:hypothetical protein
MHEFEIADTIQQASDDEYREGHPSGKDRERELQGKVGHSRPNISKRPKFPIRDNRKQYMRCDSRRKKADY